MFRVPRFGMMTEVGVLDKALLSSEIKVSRP